MKKILALFLVMTLMMAFGTVFASADTTNVHLTVDPEVTASVLAAFGSDEEDMAVAEPFLAIVNALGVKVITAEDGAQIDLDLNGADALSLGFSVDGQGITVASTLFPNYIVTVTYESLFQMMESFSSEMPGSGENSFSMADMSGMMESYSGMSEAMAGYFAEFMEACSGAGIPGEAVPGEYEIDNYVFDTLVPITVDIPTIKAAFEAMTDKMLNDEALVSAFQTSAQYSGSSFDAEELKGYLNEFEGYFPETATAEYYCNSDGSVPFYLTGEGTFAGDEEPRVEYEMLYDENSTEMRYWDDRQGMEAGFAYDETGMSMDFSYEDFFCALEVISENGGMVCEVYFMSPDKPIATLKVSSKEGGERTLSLDKQGKTEVTLEDIMGEGDAANGLFSEVMTNAGTLMGVLAGAVPEAAALLG